MTCAKAIVGCTIITRKGDVVYGENYCDNAQPRCPRTTGEGYEKCRTICQQEGHAEVMAIKSAVKLGLSLDGAVAVVTGHYYSCKACALALKASGVTEIIIRVS